MSDLARPRVIHGSASAQGLGPSVVTIGNFDGVHLGHQALLATARELATPVGASVVAYTFDPLPRDVMAPGHGVARIQSLDDRVAALGRRGADVVVIEPFSRTYAAQEASWFTDEVLTRRLGALGVVVGWDFRFGHNRLGDADALRAAFRHVAVLDALRHEGEAVSSTRVRMAVNAGDMRVAAGMLDRLHDVVGEVIHGDARGRTIGFPTANVALPDTLLPPFGVYAVRAELDGRWLDGVANLGVRPTVDAAGRTSLEVHLLDFAGDVYGKTLRVGFVEKLRGEKRFDSLDALVAQIGADVAAARRVLA